MYKAALKKRTLAAINIAGMNIELTFFLVLT